MRGKERGEEEGKRIGFKLGNKNYVVSFKFFYLLKSDTKRHRFGPNINFNITTSFWTQYKF